MEEWFDVVDDNDKVVGRRLRSDVHRLNLFHRSAHILVFNHADELFLQKRSLRKDNSPGFWDSSAAGHLTSGEDYLSAARRELREELGVTQEPILEPQFKIDACPDTGFEFTWVYRCVAEGPFALIGDIEGNVGSDRSAIVNAVSEMNPDFVVFPAITSPMADYTNGSMSKVKQASSVMTGILSPGNHNSGGRKLAC